MLSTSRVSPISQTLLRSRTIVPFNRSYGVLRCHYIRFLVLAWLRGSGSGAFQGTPELRVWPCPSLSLSPTAWLSACLRMLGHWQIILNCVWNSSPCVFAVLLYIYFIITNKCVVWRSCCGDEYVERYRSRLLLVSQYVRPRRRRRKRRLWQWQWRRRVMRCAS